MRKVIVFIIAAILLLGVSGCENIRVSQKKESSSTPDAEVSPINDEPSLIDVANACKIALAINIRNVLNPSFPLNDDIMLKDAKEEISEFLETDGDEYWPAGLSDEEERAAWELMVYKDFVADLSPEAHRALRGVAGYAGNIADAINAYNALNPDSGYITANTTPGDVKEILRGISIWPAGLSDEEERAVLKLIKYSDNIAYLTPEAEEALQGAAGYADNTASAINAYNALYPNSMLPDDVTLDEAKEALGKELWPAGLSDKEERAAWEMIIYKDNFADLVPEAKEALQEASHDKIITNASNIACAIDNYNAYIFMSTRNEDDMLPEDVTLEEAKEALEEAGLWPSYLTDAEASEAWEFIEIKDAIAEVKELD